MGVHAATEGPPHRAADLPVSPGARPPQHELVNMRETGIVIAVPAAIALTAPPSAAPAPTLWPMSSSQVASAQVPGRSAARSVARVDLYREILTRTTVAPRSRSVRGCVRRPSGRWRCLVRGRVGENVEYRRRA